MGFIGCRDGLALLLDRPRREAVLWDPLTGHQRRVAFPPGFEDSEDNRVQNGAVLRAAVDGGVHGGCPLSPFKLVLVCSDATTALACLYESESGEWGNITSVGTEDVIGLTRPSVLVGSKLCWLLGEGDILQFDFERQSLVVIEKPADAYVADYWSIQILRTEDSGLGLAVLSKLRIQLRERKSIFDGIVRWALLKTIQLDELFSLTTRKEKKLIRMQGYDEDTNSIFLSTAIGDFMLQLGSMQLKNLLKRDRIICRTFYPYRNFYTVGSTIGGRDDGPEMLNNT